MVLTVAGGLEVLLTEGRSLHAVSPSTPPIRAYGGTVWKEFFTPILCELVALLPTWEQKERLVLASAKMSLAVSV